MTYRNQNQQDTAETILKHVSYSLKFTPTELKAKKRLRPLVEGRMIYCLICMDHASASIIVAIIGEVMDRDHATVLYNVRVGRSLLTVNKTFAEKFHRVLEAYKTNVLHQFEHYNNIPQY